jgi:hypothetical protein
MAEFATTDADTVREAITNAIRSIIPRYQARREMRFEWARDQEIAGGFRKFDVQLSPEREMVDVPNSIGWHGGGVQYGSDVEIRVAYNVATPLANRFAGADHQDIAGILVELHHEIDGMFAISADGPAPVLEPAQLEGDSGRHVAVFRCLVTWFVSDTVTREAVA